MSLLLKYFLEKIQDNERVCKCMISREIFLELKRQEQFIYILQATRKKKLVHVSTFRPSKRGAKELLKKMSKVGSQRSDFLEHPPVTNREWVTERARERERERERERVRERERESEWVSESERRARRNFFASSMLVCTCSLFASTPDLVKGCAVDIFAPATSSNNFQQACAIYNTPAAPGGCISLYVWVQSYVESLSNIFFSTSPMGPICTDSVIPKQWRS